MELNDGNKFDPYYYRRYSGNMFKALFGVKPGAIKIIRRLAPGGMLFDVGCGLGHFMQAAAHYQTYGMEGSAYAAGQAGRRQDLKGRLLVGNAEKGLPLKSESIEVITALDLVEHLAQPEEFFREARRLVKPGGLLVISTPNPDSIGRTIKKDQWAGQRDPTHVNVLPPEAWENMVKEGFRVEKIFYDGLWDSPYFLRKGLWGRPVIRGLVGLAQSLFIVLPFLILNHAGIGSSRRFGENLWIFARKKDDE